MNPVALLIEDDRHFSDMLATACTDHGITVVHARDGKRAVEYMERTCKISTSGKSAPDVIVLELLVPKKDGFEVLHWMRRHRVHIPVVVVTHLGDREDIHRARELGARAVLVKSNTSTTHIVTEIQKYFAGMLGDKESLRSEHDHSDKEQKRQ